jgi:hypothetical protein
MAIPRSVRNNNPGNIERTNIAWEGLATPEEMTPEQRKETRFSVFAGPEWGFRALARDLHSKWARGLDTIRKIISVYAPPGENDTEAYVQAVSDMMEASPDQPLALGNASQLAALARAIAVHEAGGWFFSDQDLNEGVRMALGEPPPPTTV